MQYSVCAVCLLRHDHSFTPLLLPTGCTCTLQSWMDILTDLDTDEAGRHIIPNPCSSFYKLRLDDEELEEYFYCEKCGHLLACHVEG